MGTIGFGKRRKKGVKRFFVILIAFCWLLTSIPVFAADSSNKALFPDIQDHWAQGTVETMSRIKVFDGYPDGNFHPDQPLTRAEFLTSLRRAVDMGLILQVPKNNNSTPGFNDVKPGDWFSDDVTIALERGWITTHDVGQALHPNDPITRKEMARIIARVTSQMTVQLPKNDPELFQDVEQTNPYFSDIYAVVGAGILNGYSDGTYHPDGNLTRAEASTVIVRTLQLDKPKSPYSAPYSKWGWEASKMANMFIYAGWEDLFSQKGSDLKLDDLQSFASGKAISQYKNYLDFIKSTPDVDANSNGIWMGEFYPTYVNNNLVLASWSLSFGKKIGEGWYQQQTKPFTIVIRRHENRKWVVEDFPVEILKMEQRDRPLNPPRSSTPFISLKYQDEGGVYFGHIWIGTTKPLSEPEAVPFIKDLFATAPGKVQVLRVFGHPLEDSQNGSLIEQLQSRQPVNNTQIGTHSLVVSKNGNWFEFINGTSDKILSQLWVNFNFYGGSNVVISLDGIPWTEMSDDPFWRKLQGMESSKKVMENSTELFKEFEMLLKKYQHKN